MRDSGIIGDPCVSTEVFDFRFRTCAVHRTFYLRKAQRIDERNVRWTAHRGYHETDHPEVADDDVVAVAPPASQPPLRSVSLSSIQFSAIVVIECSHLHAVAHISDLHIGSSPERSFALQRICSAILATDIETVVVTGDITNCGSVSEFEEFSTITSRLRAERNVILLPGNHDRSRANISTRMMNDEQVNLLSNDGVAILRIDTTIWYNRITFASHGNISKSMLTSVDQLLAQIPEQTFVIVALHHHPLPLPAEILIEYISSWFSLPFAEHLSYGSRLLEKIKGRCDLVLHGHRHVPSEIVFPYTQRSLAIYNAGSSTGLCAFRRFDIHDGRLIGEPIWISV